MTKTHRHSLNGRIRGTPIYVTLSKFCALLFLRVGYNITLVHCVSLLYWQVSNYILSIYVWVTKDNGFM